MGGNIEIGGGAGTVDILGNVSTYSQYVGIAMTILFVLFIIVAVLASLWKRVTKNIFNVVIIALSCLATFFGSKIAIKQVLNIEAVKSFIADNLLSIEIFQGSSVAFIEAAAIALVTVIVTPILYCIIHAIIKAVCYLISLCIPPFRRLMKRKIDGQPVRITAGARIVSACLGVVVGCFSYFMICMPVFSLTNLATGIINELPIEAIMESEQEESASLGGATLYSAGSQEGGEQTGESSASLKSTLQMVGSVSKAISPFSDSLMFKMYGGLGINKLVQNYADNVSALDYEVDGMHYTTKGFSDLTNVGKGVVILGSYIVCEMDKESFPENPIDLTKLQDGIYYVLGNNVIIDTAEPLIKDVLSSLCKESFGLSPEDTDTVLETIHLKDIITMADSDKRNETDQIAIFISKTISSIKTIEEHGSEMLNYTEAFGSLLDGMAETNSFAKTPGKLVKAFTDSNEIVQKYLNTDSDNDGVTTLDNLVNNVEGGKTTYTAYLANIQAGLNIAMSLGGKDIEGNENQDKTEEEIKETIKQDFGSIYENTNEAVKEVMIEIVQNATQEIVTSEETQEIKNTLVTDYFENLYDYAEELKQQAGEDPVKQQEAKEKFEKEAESITSVIGLVGDLAEGQEIGLETIEELADAITSSELIKQTAQNLNEKQEVADAKQELQNRYNEIDQQTKQDIQNMLNDKIDGSASLTDIENIQLLKDLLGITD